MISNVEVTDRPDPKRTIGDMMISKDVYVIPWTLDGVNSMPYERMSSYGFIPLRRVDENEYVIDLDSIFFDENNTDLRRRQNLREKVYSNIKETLSGSDEELRISSANETVNFSVFYGIAFSREELFNKVKDRTLKESDLPFALL